MCQDFFSEENKEDYYEYNTYFDKDDHHALCQTSVSKSLGL